MLTSFVKLGWQKGGIFAVGLYVGVIRGQMAPLAAAAAVAVATALLFTACAPASARVLTGAPQGPAARPLHSLQSPTLTAVSPNPVQSGSLLTVNITDPNGSTVASVSFTYYAADRHTVVATFPATGLTSAGSKAHKTYWVATATAPTVQNNTAGHLAATDTLASGQSTPRGGEVSLTVDGQPLNQLPETPYAALFPLILLLAFGVFRRRRRAA